jgi:hypothetical protein
MESYRDCLVQVSIEAVVGHISYNIGIFDGMEYSGEYLRLLPCPKNKIENAGEALHNYLINSSGFMTPYVLLLPSKAVRGIQILEPNKVGEETTLYVNQKTNAAEG